VKPGTVLPLVVRDSVLRSNTVIDDNLATKLSSLNVQWQMYGGHWQLAPTFNVTKSTGEEWLEDGLGRHIELYAPSAVKIWEGFVNSITLNIGGLSITRGPMIGGVENRNRVIYSTVDTGTDPPTMGIRSETVWAENAASIARYGQHERVISVGGATAASAAQISATALAERSEPPTSESDNLANSVVPSVSIIAMGYIHWLQSYTLDLTTTGLQNASNKLIAVLGADPNGIFSTSYSAIEANAVQVGAYDRDYRIAESVIKAIIALGNAANERTTLIILNGRVAEYKTVSSTPIYQRRIAEAAQRLENYQQGGWVEPYNVDPGEIVFYTDLLAGKPVAVTSAIAKSDPRYMRIERATYTLPMALNLQGESFSQLDQTMKRFGLGGTVA